VLPRENLNLQNLGNAIRYSGRNFCAVIDAVNALNGNHFD